MKKIFTLILAIALSTIAFGQNINSVNVSSNPTDCSNTTVAVAATQLCINYNYVGISHTIVGNVINVDLNWTSPGPICLGALGSVNDVANIGQVPAGNYTLNVQAFLDGTLQNSATQPLNIISCCPVEAIATQSATNICLGETAVLYDNSTGATATHWSKDGITISAADSLVIAETVPGNYSYHLVATDGNCSDSTLYTVTINGYPTVDLGPDTSTCAGQAILLSTNVSGTNYLWSTGTTGGSITVTTGGTYTLTVSNNGCSGTDSIVVTSLPTPTFNLGPNQIVCQGTGITLDATVANQTGLIYTWSNGETTPTIMPLTSGTYGVTVTNTENCSHSDDIVINFEDLPIVNLGADTTLCNGASFLINGVTPNIISYSWNTGQTTNTLLVDSAATYTLTVMTDNGCSGSDDIVISYENITVNFNDTVDLVSGSPITLDAGNAGATYLWSNGATTQTIDVDSIGTFSVTVTTALGCTATNSVEVVNTTSTTRLEKQTLAVFPNPANNFIVVEANDLNLETATIINNVGQIVGKVTIQNNTQINVEYLTSGMYFIQFQNRNGEIVGAARFVKQ